MYVLIYYRQNNYKAVTVIHLIKKDNEMLYY